MKAFLLFLYNEMPENVSVTISIIKTSESPSLAKTIKLRFIHLVSFQFTKYKEVTLTVELLKDGANINSYIKETIRKILKEL